MHVFIGLLGSIVTILYPLKCLNKMGIDFGCLNPFHWRCRRAQAQSMLEMMTVVVTTGGKMFAKQRSFIDALGAQFVHTEDASESWS